MKLYLRNYRNYHNGTLKWVQVQSMYNVHVHGTGKNYCILATASVQFWALIIIIIQQFAVLHIMRLSVILLFDIKVKES